MEGLKLFSTLSILVLFFACSTTKKDWIVAKQVNMIEAYQDFLKEHPESRYEDKAKESIVKIKQKNAWMKAKQVNTIEAYQDFLKEYPESRYEDKAKKRIEKMVWENTKREDTEKAYQKFLVKYPESEFSLLAQKRLDATKEWEEIKHNNSTIDSYAKFIKLYPNTKYFKIAKDKIKEKLIHLANEETRNEISLDHSNTIYLFKTKEIEVTDWNGMFGGKEIIGGHESMVRETTKGLFFSFYPDPTDPLKFELKTVHKKNGKEVRLPMKRQFIHPFFRSEYTISSPYFFEVSVEYISGTGIVIDHFNKQSYGFNIR